MLYSDTGVSGSIPGVGLDRHFVLYYWLIPNRNVQDGISIIVSWVRQASVNGTESFECGSNGRVILDFDGCIGCSFAGSGGGGGCWLGCTGAGCSRILPITHIPTVVQIRIVIIPCVCSRDRRGCGW